MIIKPTEKKTQKLYKTLSEAATILCDALIYGEASETMIDKFITTRKEAVNVMGQDWVNTVIEQSFKLIIGE
ncbi:MAG: hypothetical protein AMQ22_00698 [Candidatus Methanofastidiosum methylothiophilum]|uniref:Uncharacterized protein n=1 Tax=Candidatus Methanofastidiosum methylothiophilum TaxID=1705564 RepID=A0A150J6D2_9EURY|nr:MAG: hypothetical protein AMQ22_00698 [Candidatus Methanofastidiosum methylthiophilus]